MRRGTDRKWGALALVLVLLCAVVTGCGLAKRPALAGEQELPPAPTEMPPPRTITAALYFADWQAQHLIPEARQIPEAEGAVLATALVRELVKGPTDPHLNRSLPTGTELLEPVTIQDGVAYVNLSNQMANLRGSAEIMMALGSLGLSLTEVPGVEKVQLLIDGRREGGMEGAGREPMARSLLIYPVLVDTERIAYLQTRFDQGIETWRADPARVVQWEGRMFGFTQAELETARLEQAGKTATAQVTSAGTTYTMHLVQNETAPGKTGIWTIQSIE